MDRRSLSSLARAITTFPNELSGSSVSPVMASMIDCSRMKSLMGPTSTMVSSVRHRPKTFRSLQGYSTSRLQSSGSTPLRILLTSAAAW